MAAGLLWPRSSCCVVSYDMHVVCAWSP
jgi:hypothetical protein